jgi:hypothetical protein
MKNVQRRTPETALYRLRGMLIRALPRNPSKRSLRAGRVQQKTQDQVEAVYQLIITLAESMAPFKKVEGLTASHCGP